MITTYNAYCVIDLDTGKWLPALNSDRLGSTKKELTNEQSPRIFNNTTAANAAIKHWKKGRQHVRYDSYGDYHIDNEPVPERVDINLVVAEVSMTIYMKSMSN